jgi:hypothetical protein
MPTVWLFALFDDPGWTRCLRRLKVVLQKPCPETRSLPIPVPLCRCQPAVRYAQPSTKHLASPSVAKLLLHEQPHWARPVEGCWQWMSYSCRPLEPCCSSCQPSSPSSLPWSLAFYHAMLFAIDSSVSQATLDQPTLNGCIHTLTRLLGVCRSKDGTNEFFLGKNFREQGAARAMFTTSRAGCFSRGRKASSSQLDEPYAQPDGRIVRTAT